MTVEERLDEVMASLEQLGTAQNRKVYARHGAQQPMFGVSYANLNELARSHKRDHELALALFGTGNHDARQLAVKVADPEQVTVTVANQWAKAADCYITAEAVAGVIAASPHARDRSDLWRDRRAEWTASIGWAIVAYTAEDSIWTTGELRDLLRQIETEIEGRPNRVRHEMNQALITIGLRNGALRRQAIAAARRIGRVDVDHGETSCVTPDAVAYIEKTTAHRAKKAQADTGRFVGR